VNHEVRAIDEKKAAVGGERVDHESAVKKQPRHQRGARDGFPERGIVEK
jgi:hypothetical protein